MKSKKVLIIKELYFNLPDDFEGDKTDAFELLAKYRREQDEKGAVTDCTDDKGKNYDMLFQLLKNKASKVYDEANILDIDSFIKYLAKFVDSSKEEVK